MKKLILILCILGICKIASAQWTTSGSDIYNSNAGNVGIGTTTPLATLEIAKAALPTTITRANAYLHIGAQEATNGYALISLGYADVARTYMPAYIGFQQGTSAGGDKGDLIFGTRDVTTDTAPTERMRINAAGDVGIGTTNPVSMLSVNGSMQLQDASANVGTQLKFLGSNAQHNFMVGNQQNISDVLEFTPSTTGGGSTFTNPAMVITGDSNVGIGTTSPTEKLSVNGRIQAKEVKVETGWSDFVFEPHYKLRGLKETERFIKANKHLPEIPSTKEVTENGINLGEMNAKLLQKIEELTLYLIDQNKEIKEQGIEIKDLQEEIKKLKSGQ